MHGDNVANCSTPSTTYILEVTWREEFVGIEKIPLFEAKGGFTRFQENLYVFLAQKLKDKHAFCWSFDSFTNEMHAWTGVASAIVKVKLKKNNY